MLNGFKKTLSLQKKNMDCNKIQKVLDNNVLLEQFTEILINEINNDDEPYDKKGRQLLSLCLNNKNAEDFFIAICGWSVDSLLDKMNI